MAKQSDYTNFEFQFQRRQATRQNIRMTTPTLGSSSRNSLNESASSRRKSRYHLKHRKVNYFPSTEVITIDGRGRHPETGPDAFLDLLDQLYPRRRPAKPDPLSLRDEEPAPSSLILDISLDSGDDMGNPARSQARQRR